MPNVENAYCEITDLRTGDLSEPSYTSREQYIKGAADEIDAALGAIYVTPIVLENISANRPSALILKKVNWLLASGRFICDVAAAGEQDNLNAYGRRLLDEGSAILKDLMDRRVNLVGAPLVPDENPDGFTTGPTIHNEDPESLVEGFYRQRRPGFEGILYPQVTPYGQ